MKKTTPDMTAVTSGYSGTVRAAFQHRKPVWAVAAFDVAAVLLAVGLIHTVSGMIFNTSRSGDPPGTSARAAGAENPATMLPALAAAARVVAAMPDEGGAALVDDQLLFAAPLVAEARFGPVVNAPPEGSFAPVAAIGGTPGAGGIARPPTVVAGAGAPPENGTVPPSSPAEESPVAIAPALLTYIPAPRPVADVAAVVATPLPKVINVVEQAVADTVAPATGAPLSLAPPIAATAGSGADGQSQPEAATGGAAQSIGIAVTTTASSTVQTASNITTAVTAPVATTVKAVTGLLN